MKFIYIVVFLSVVPFGAFADDVHERAKAKIVSRVYQVSFGAEEYCQKASPQNKKSFDDALKNFLTKNGQLVRMIQSSPYYENAKTTMESNKNKSVNVIDNDCQGLTWMLNSLINTTEGQKTIEESEKILRN
ncbi:hypothetical protein [Sulfuricurvum sp.]|uniref:hypothetical protein n=1 Tax=Sulfuricurvum sp. TaxID=2025608 RepID=UPI003BB55F7D